MRGNCPSNAPPIANITLPKVWEAQNNNESLKIIRKVLQGNVSYPQERNLSPDTCVLLKLAKQGEIGLEQRPDLTAENPEKALYEVLVKTASIINQILIPESLQDTLIRSVHQSGGHLGVTKTIKGVIRKMWWPSL